jgi:hypothetical protein
MMSCVVTDIESGRVKEIEFCVGENMRKKADSNKEILSMFDIE